MSTERTINTKFHIDGEAEVKAALKNLNSELKLLSSELKSVESEYQGNANSMEALNAKAQVLEKQLAAQKDKLATLRGALTDAQAAEQAFAAQAEETRQKISDKERELERLKSSTDDTREAEAQLTAEIAGLKTELTEAETKQAQAANTVRDYQTKVNGAQAEVHNLNHKIDENNGYLTEAAKSADNCATSIDECGKKTRTAAEESEDFGNKSSAAVNDLAGALAAAGISATVKEITEAMLDCAAAAAEFETAVAKVTTLADEAVMSAADLSSAFLALSNATGQSAAGLAEASYQALSAGVDTANAMAFVETSTQLAVGGFTSATSAVDVLTTILNAYKLEASEAAAVADILVKTQDMGKTTVDELASSMGRIIPTAAAYNFEIDNLATGYAELTKQGQSTRIATTSFAAMLDELADSSSNVARVLQEETGKSFAQLNADGASLGDVIGILTDSVGGSSEAFADLWNNTTAARAANALFSAGADSLNDTLEEMRNSTGAAAENYAILADTTEFAQNRMTAAMDNLKITIGDTLNPALKELYNTGADAFDWATDFVSEHPELVAGITATVTVMGALTAGILGVAAAIKVVQALQMGSAVGLTAVAVAGVVSALAGLVVALGSAKTETQLAKREMEEYRESAAEARGAFDDWQLDFSDKTQSVTSLVDTIVGLSDAEGRTTAETEVLKAAIEQLNTLVPDLALEFDEATGSINMTAETLIAAAQAALKQEQMQAIAAEIAAEYDRQAAAAERLREADAMLTAEKEKLAQAEEDYANGSIFLDELELQRYAVEDAQAVFAGYSAEVSESGRTIRELTGDLEGMTGGAGEAADATDDYADALLNLASVIAEIETEMDALNDAYEKSKEAAKSSITSTIGLFGDLDAQVSMSTDDMIAAWEKQAQQIEQYNENIKKATEAGISEGLVAKLSDGSAESAAHLQVICDELDNLAEAEGGVGDDTQAFIDQFNAAYEKSDSAADAWAETVARIETDFDETMAALEARLQDAVAEMQKSEEAAAAAEDTVNGFVQRCQSKTGEVYQVGVQIGQAVIEGLRAGVDAHSPSRAAGEVADDTADGYTQRLKSQEAAAYAGGRAFSEAAIAGMASVTDSGTFDFSGTSMGAEAALEAFKSAKAELDHLRNIDTVSEAEYYARLLGLRDEYLRDYGNLDTWRSTTESIYKYQQSVLKNGDEAYQQAVSDMDYYLALGLMSQEEYYAQLERLRDLCLEQDSEAWRSATVAIYKYQQSVAKSGGEMYQSLLSELEHYYAMGLVTTEDYWARRKELMEFYLDSETEAYRKAQEEMRKAGSAIYNDKKSELDFWLALDLISEREYYAQLEQLRDTYLEEDSDAWRTATQQLYSYRQNQLKAALDEANALIQESLDAQLKMIDEHLAKRKEQINAELEAERERVSGIIAAIKAEIAARKEARTELGYEDAIADAQKRVDWLEAQIAYERDADNLAELEKELIRAQEELAKAEQSYEDYLWEKTQQEEIARHEENLAAMEAAAAAQIAELEEIAEQSRLAANAAAAAAFEAAERKYDDQLNTLIDQMDKLVSSAALFSANQTSGAGLGGTYGAGYDANVDYAAMMLSAKNEEEFNYWKAKRDAKMAGEGLNPDDYASNDELYEQWLASAQAQQTLAQTAALAAAATAETIYNNTQNTASVTINEAASLTTGQIEAAVVRVLERVGA